jgi:hypothetical protein
MDHRTCSDCERGFTLVELLLVCAIIIILGALSVQAYVIHKQNAYHSIALETLHSAQLALEAGKIHSDEFPDAILIVNSMVPGPVSGGFAEMLVPGMVLPGDSQLMVMHNPLCRTGSCISDQIQTRHCKAEKVVKYWNIYVMGVPQRVMITDAAPDGAC